MTTANSRSWLGKSWVFTAFALSGATLATAESSLSQILPDNTLGQEKSVVTPLSPQVDRIDGGAMRGTSLFHSFSEFNIGEGRGAYFANPIGIETIFSRVTGSNPSNLFGTLGVLGDANLFFINPNGILFGPNASLDIRGSFVASTASSVTLSNGAQFSARNPQAPPLLTVDVRAPIGLQFEGEQPGVIVNNGNLETGQHLALVGGTVVSTGELSAPKGEVAVSTVAGGEASSEGSEVQLSQTGQLLKQELQPLSTSGNQTAMSAISLPEVIVEWGEPTGLRVNDSGQVELASSNLPVETGDVVVQQLNAQTATLSAANNLTLVESQLQTTGDMHLLARDTVRVRDTEANPFIATAGGKLLVQGSQGVDIFALNHLESGLFSGGDMVLRSADTIGGDAHYWSGGSFRIEQMDGSLGSLFSPYDPIIRASGDVNFASYTGASLHILAGGSVKISGNVIITNPDTEGNSIREDVTLSDGETIVPINGIAQPTLDIRAGTTAFYPTGTIGDTAGLTPNSLSASATGTSADITIGTIFNPSGTVFLTNQYQPNRTLPGGTIQVGGIDTSYTSSSSGSGSIFLDSRSNITLSNSVIQALTKDDDGGDITLIAQNEVSLLNSRLSNQTVESGQGNAGDITIKTGSLVVSHSSDTESILSRTLGQGDAGNVTIQATESIFFNQGAKLLARPGGGSQGNGGNVIIEAAESIFFNEGSAVFAGGTEGRGNGGNVRIQANNDNISFADGAVVNANSSGEGNAGTITIQATNGNISFSNQASVSTLAQAQGNAGDVFIRANQGNISFTDAEIRANTEPIDPNAPQQGNGGNVTIQADNGSVSLSNAGIFATTGGRGNGGNIAIQAAEEITVDGVSSRVFTGSRSENRPPLLGNSGNVDLRARSITISNDAGVQAGTAGQGKGGQVTIQATDSVTVKDAVVETQTSGEGDAGSVRIQAGNSITIEGNGSDSGGEGISSGSRRLAGSPAILGNGGEVELSATSLFFNNGATLNVKTEGQGNGGSAVIQARDSVFFTNGALVLADTISSGNAGNIFIQAHNTIFGDNSNIWSRNRRQDGFPDPTGNGGEIILSARSIDFRNRAQVRADTEGSGTGGSITLQSMDTISFISNAALSSDTTGVGDGGRITIQSGDAVSLSDSAVVSARTLGAGKGGSITIQADGIFSVDDAQATVSSFESGDAGELDVDAKFVRLDNQGQLTATARVSNGGNIGLEVENILLMRRGSLISARSEGQNSRDGNIEINAGGIVAFPAENSDIIARSANRGDIDINAQAIFGFQANEGLDAIPESELSATGNINLNLGVDPSRGLTPLLEQPRSTGLAEGCQASDGKDTVEYFDIGRGGTPPRPDEPLNADTVIAEWIPFDSEVAKENGQEGSGASNENAMHTAQEPTATPRLAPPCQNR
ncbi:MAG: filamentous hemagglutinin N-terminal domain-containing protein [Coleofasciculus sp. S288]|nr:filamentous hemagglutinin N-terminal domain-containing protein [Coleofasciculus sp. S288]